MSRDFLIWFVAALLGMTATLAAGLVALDPYDTGRFSLVSKPGMPKDGPRLSNASRARDPGFDGAIIGNSHIQLVSPQRLRGLSGVRFVQLAIPGTGPTEQMQILAAFLRAHADPPKAIVIGIDEFWCVAERNPVPSHPFPGWLYSENDATYLSGLFRMASVRALAMRIAFLAGFKARSAADGYWDYEEGQVKPDAFAVQPPSRAMSEAKIDHFGPSDTLGDLLQATPASTRVVLVIAPIHAASLPGEGTVAAMNLAACIATYRAVIDGRPLAALLDFRQDTPATRASENFWDATHYAKPLAEMIEQAIARALH